MSDQIDPSHELSLEIFKFLAEKHETDTITVLTAVSRVLATIAVEAGMEEEKAVYAFRKSFGSAERRLKQFLKQAQH